MRSVPVPAYLRAARRTAARVRYQPETLLHEQHRIFSDFDIDYDQALEHLGAALDSAGLPPYSERSSMCSQHWIFFSGLAQLLPHDPRILEIGTYKAEFTRVLAAMFPGAEIVTCDLPDESPTFAKTYNRESDEAHAAFVDGRDSILAQLPNTRFVQANSFYLPEVLSGEKFDAVWVDGNHDYPDVAWDACNAYHLASEGGYILFDDVYTDATSVSKRVTPDFNDSFALTQILASEGVGEFAYIVKRLTSAASADRAMRKHIAVTVKRRFR